MTARAFIENNAPWLLAFSAGAVHHFAWPQLYPNPEKATEFFANIVDISGITVGFLATGQMLLCSLEDNFIVKILRKYNRFQGMLRFFTEAICWCLTLAVFSLLTYWIDFKEHSLLFSIWFGLLVGTFFATVRIIGFFAAILHGGKQ